MSVQWQILQTLIVVNLIIVQHQVAPSESYVTHDPLFMTIQKCASKFNESDPESTLVITENMMTTKNSGQFYFKFSNLSTQKSLECLNDEDNRKLRLVFRMSTSQNSTMDVDYYQLEPPAINGTFTESSSVKFLPSGEISYRFKRIRSFYSPSEYCLRRHNSSYMEAHICLSGCDPLYQVGVGNSSARARLPKEEICVPKCCPPGNHLNVGTVIPGQSVQTECVQNVGQNDGKWKPIFFDKRSQDSCISKTEMSPMYRIFNYEPKLNLTSTHIHPSRTFSIGNVTYNRRSFRLLENGSVFLENFMRSPMTLKPRWIKQDVEFCLDSILIPDAHDPKTFRKVEVVVVMSSDNKTLRGSRLSRDKMEKLQHWHIAANVVSLVPLGLTLVAYGLTWSIQNIHGYAVFCHILCAFFSSLFVGLSRLFSLPGYWGHYPKSCQIIGVLVHFVFLGMLFWLTVVNFDLWRTFKRPKVSVRMSVNARHLRRIIFYTLFAWGGPLVIVITGFVLDRRYGIYGEDSDCDIVVPNYGRDYCFLTKESEGLWFFYPSMLLIPPNILFFVWIVRVLIQQKKAQNDSIDGLRRSQADIISAKLFVKFFIVMGISFIAEGIFWSFTQGSKRFFSAWVFINFLNRTIRAICIFLIFACHGKTFDELKMRYPWPWLTIKKNTLRNSSSNISRKFRDGQNVEHKTLIGQTIQIGVTQSTVLTTSSHSQ